MAFENIPFNLYRNSSIAPIYEAFEKKYKPQFDEASHTYQYLDGGVYKKTDGSTTGFFKHYYEVDKLGHVNPEELSVISKSTMSRASERGSRVHKAIEEYVKDEMFGTSNFNISSLGEKESKSFNQFRTLIDKLKAQDEGFKFLGTELPVLGKLENKTIAGSIDLKFLFKGEVYTADYKTTSGELPPESVGKQLAAYQEYERQMAEKLGYKDVPSKRAVFHISHKNDLGYLYLEGQEKQGIFKGTDLKDYIELVKQGSRKDNQLAPDIIKKARQYSLLRGTQQGITRQPYENFYFGTKNNFPYNSVKLTEDEFERSLHPEDVEAWNILKQDAKELGLTYQISTSKAGEGANFKFQHDGKTALDTIKNFRTFESKRLGEEALLKKNAFLNTEIPKFQDLLQETKSLLEPFSQSPKAALLAGAGVGAAIGLGYSVLRGAKRDEYSTYEEDPHYARNTVTGAVALGALAGLSSGWGEMAGNIGDITNKYISKTKTILESVPGIRFAR